MKKKNIGIYILISTIIFCIFGYYTVNNILFHLEKNGNIVTIDDKGLSIHNITFLYIVETLILMFYYLESNKPKPFFTITFSSKSFFETLSNMPLIKILLFGVLKYFDISIYSFIVTFTGICSK